MAAVSSPASRAGPIAALGAGVALLSGGLIATELLLTRLLSAQLWYHFAFLAISVALLGGSMGGVAVHLLQRRLGEHGLRWLAAASTAALGPVLVAVELALLRIAPDWFGTGADAMFTSLTLRLAVLIGFAVLPFLLGGTALASVMRLFAARAHVVYGADLIGAAAGCIAVPLGIGTLGGPGALLLLAFLCAPAAGALAWGAGLSRRSAIRLAAAGLAVVAAAGWTAHRTGGLELRVAKGINLEERRPEFVAWNSYALVTVLDGGAFSGWGPSPRGTGPVPPQKTLVIDMNALTPLIAFDGDFHDVSFVARDLSAFVYLLRPRAAEVCVLGAGGGKDVLAALALGAGRVTAVEINEIIVRDVMLGRYRAWTGGLYARPDVQVVTADARGFIHRTDRRFDILQISMVDTSAATGVGAYALTENGLYTREAFADYLDRLAPGGILSVATLSLPDLALGARLALLAREAVAERGGDPRRGIVVLRLRLRHPRAVWMNNVLVKPDGFSSEEIERIDRLAGGMGFERVRPEEEASAAADREASWIVRILAEPDTGRLDEAVADWPLDVSAPTDDRPYFFYQNRLRDWPEVLLAPSPSHLLGNGLYFLAHAGLAAGLLLLLLVGIPFLLARGGLPGIVRRRGRLLVVAATLGLGFLCLELALVQRLGAYLGRPAWALALVLGGLLFAAGLGSRLWAGSGGSGRASGARYAPVVLTLVGITAGWLLPPLLSATLRLGDAGRLAVAAAVTLPVGLVAGVPFPWLLRHAGDEAPEAIPWIWAVNGAAGVFGSVLATVVSVHAGIRSVFLVAAAAYGLAFVAGFVWRRPNGSGGSGSVAGGAPDAEA